MEENRSADTYEATEKEEVDEKPSLMNQPFDPTRIKIETKTPSLDTLIRRIERAAVQLNTESYFQRKANLWDHERQSRLIESILIQFPLPAFFFDATNDNNWLVVDGLQRLSSIRNFVVEKSLKLTRLEFLTHLNGLGWDDLKEDLQRIIVESQVVIYKILPGTPTDVKFNIFKRINTGGLVLEPQEIRHALFQGRPAQFIAQLAETDEFKKATSGKINPERMEDRDFINRFLCFYLFDVKNYGTKEYGQDLDSFMSKAMASIYEKSETELQNIVSDFKKAMILSEEIFEKQAFRKIYDDTRDRLPPINKALFDVISVQFSLLNDAERFVLREHKDEVKKSLYEELHKKEEFYIAVTTSTGDKNKVILRHNIVKELIHSIIGK